MEEAKLAFVGAALRQYGQEVIQEMQRRIVSTKSVDTSTLLRSLRFRAFQQSADGNLHLNFAQWGRFLDMGVRRGHPLSGVAGTDRALRRKMAGPRKIYSPVAYGKLNWLMGELSYGFTEEVINNIKTQLNASNGNTTA